MPWVSESGLVKRRYASFDKVPAGVFNKRYAPVEQHQLNWRVVKQLLQRFSLGCMVPVHAKRQPAKENSQSIPYICSGTALGC